MPKSLNGRAHEADEIGFETLCGSIVMTAKLILSVANMACGGALKTDCQIVIYFFLH